MAAVGRLRSQGLCTIRMAWASLMPACALKTAIMKSRHPPPRLQSAHSLSDHSQNLPGNLPSGLGFRLGETL